LSSGHLLSGLAQRRSAAALLAVIGVDPHPHVDFAASEFAKDRPDFLGAGDGDEPDGVFGVDA
jgi:hypothetical protein